MEAREVRSALSAAFLCAFCGNAFNAARRTQIASSTLSRVPVETPTPPALRKKCIGKETLTGRARSGCVSFSNLSIERWVLGHRGVLGNANLGALRANS